MSPPTDPTSEPIINSPYDPPDWHWSLDDSFRACAPAVEGRRPSGAYLPVPRPRSKVQSLDFTDESCQDIEPHRQINAIRAAVEQWRADGYPGARPSTMALIDHWNNPDTDGLKPYFCQRDAVETAIFLTEAPNDRRQPFLDRLDRLNAEHNDAIQRIALKLATATGKTHVMAMLILWQAKSRHCSDFVIFVPNLTIKDRLAELQCGSTIYDDLRPKGDKTRFRVTVLNFQQWQPRSGIGVDGQMTKDNMRAMAIDEDRYRRATTESEAEMIDRLLKDHRGHQQICVLNDEAHHCYDESHAGRQPARKRDRRRGRRPPHVVQRRAHAARPRPPHTGLRPLRNADVACAARPPESHRCSSRGR